MAAGVDRPCGIRNLGDNLSPGLPLAPGAGNRALSAHERRHQACVTGLTGIPAGQNLNRLKMAYDSARLVQTKEEKEE